MVQRLTALTCKYIKARPKKKGLQKCVLRGIVSVFHFFDAWTFPSADIYLNNANEQGFQKREQVGQISVLPFQWPESICMQWQPRSLRDRTGGTWMHLDDLLGGPRPPACLCECLWEGWHFLLSLCREGCKAPGFPGHLVPVKWFRDALLVVAAAAAYSLPALLLWKEQGQSFAPCLVSCTAQPSRHCLFHSSYLTSVEPPSVLHREPLLLLLTGRQVSNNLF